MDKEKEKYLILYYENNGKKIRNIVNNILSKFGGISQKDYDDFYSIANMVFARIIDTYDPNKDFHHYFCSCLANKIKTEITRRNREKRKTDRESISIDTPISDDLSILDTLKSDFSVMDELSDDVGLSENIDKYFNLLSVLQVNIAKLIMEGYSPSEIMKKLNITEKQYSKCINDMRSFEKIRTLKHTEQIQIEEEKQMNYTHTLEKSKTNRLSIASIIKKIDNYTIRFDHPLQRQSDQWCPAMKGNLISDVLQGNPIPPLVFAEQIVNGLAIIWDLDGKQRCTNVYSFKNDGYKITKNIRRWNITYQATLKDENGNPILDENGFPKSEKREFDIRGKKFSELPDELKEKFLDYNFEIVQYLNCSSEDIAYHISRYNEGKPMSTSQKGIVMIGEEFASIVKSISAMPFFKDYGNFTVKDTKNGTIERVVVESVMASNFLEQWKKDQQSMCDFIKNNATVEMFDSFEDMVDRITNVGTDEIFDMFNSKDSFVWFGLFSKFTKMGVEDSKFVDFMTEFEKSMRDKNVDGITYNELCIDRNTGKSKSTKDKYIVVTKIKLLEKIMNEYLLGVENGIEKNYSELDFIRENVSDTVTEEDVSLYKDTLDDLTVNVDNSSKLLEKQNELSLLAIVAFSFENDIDLDGWIVNYFERNTSYNSNQEKNYEHMKYDLLNFLEQNVA